MAKPAKKRNGRRQGRLIKSEFARLKRWIMRLFGFLAAIFFAVGAYAGDRGEPLWQKSDTGIDEAKIRSVCVIKEAPRVIFAGAERGLYKSVDSGKSWYRVFMLKGERKGINFISYHPQDTYRIFAATGDGLYISNDGGKNWKRYFKGRDDRQREVTWVAIDKTHPGSIFIATKRGLFQSRDAGRHWLGQASFVNKEIISVAIGDKAVYVCAIDGVYSCDRKILDLWERLYVQKTQEQEDINGDNAKNNSDEEESSSGLNQLCTYKDMVYLAADNGLFAYKEGEEGQPAEEKRWQRLSNEGLLTKGIRFVLPEDKAIFAATDKGVFFYNEKDKRWKSISSGLASHRVNALDFVTEERLLYAGSDRGLYKAELDNSQTKPQPAIERRVETVISKEPTITEIQHAAIEYAEVSPRKIEWMRSSARNKAWLPKVSAGLDGDVYRTLDLDRGGTADPDFYIEGPKDKNWGWDIDLTWDLGELIWNQDQCNIDVRSKLMVQLRNDVLDEVTKLYFERRRLQLEIYANPPEAEGEEALKQLRLEELTANIDALTGGYLSEAIKEQR